MSGGITAVLAVTMVAGLGGAAVMAQASRSSGNPVQQGSKLAVLWTSGDPGVAYRVCFMYAHNAKKHGWFDEVRLIVWGPSARLLAADKDIEAAVMQMMEDGVEVQACIACANSYGVSQRIRDMGIEVKGMGPPLTQMLQSDWKVLTF